MLTNVKNSFTHRLSNLFGCHTPSSGWYSSTFCQNSGLWRWTRSSFWGWREPSLDRVFKRIGRKQWLQMKHLHQQPLTRRMLQILKITKCRKSRGQRLKLVSARFTKRFQQCHRLYSLKGGGRFIGLAISGCHKETGKDKKQEDVPERETKEERGKNDKVLDHLKDYPYHYYD